MVVVVVDGDMLARRGMGTTLGGLVRIRKGTLWPLHAWVCVDGYMAWMLSQHRTLSTSDSTATSTAASATRRPYQGLGAGGAVGGASGAAAFSTGVGVRRWWAAMSKS